MHFKEYFFRNGQIWKLLTDGAEIVVPGAEFAALIDLEADTVLSHGALHQVASAAALHAKANPGLAEDRFKLVHCPMRGATAQLCERFNIALGEGTGRDLARIVTETAHRHRSAA